MLASITVCREQTEVEKCWMGKFQVSDYMPLLAEPSSDLIWFELITDSCTIHPLNCLNCCMTEPLEKGDWIKVSYRVQVIIIPFSQGWASIDRHALHLSSELSTAGKNDTNRTIAGVYIAYKPFLMRAPETRRGALWSVGLLWKIDNHYAGQPLARWSWMWIGKAQRPLRCIKYFQLALNGNWFNTHRR